MDCKIDYLAWTIPTRVPFDAVGEGSVKPALMVVTEFLGDFFAPIANGHIWEVHKAKGFYHTRIFDAETKISVFVGTINRHVYVEIGGVACDYIRTLGAFDDLIQKVCTRTSRIDFAVDMECDEQPHSFIVNNDRKSFKAHSNVSSEDGETCYIGSWKGERFARVYRYHEPHPRAKLLRAEVVLRGDYARQGIALVLAEGEVAAAMAAHQPFDWRSENWKPDVATSSRIKSQRSDKEGAATIRWLHGDVVSALVKNHRDGLINALDWWEKVVKPRL